MPTLTEAFRTRQADIINSVRLLFGEQLYHEAKYLLQLFSLVMVFDKLSYKKQKELFDKLFIVKDLICSVHPRQNNADTIKYNLHTNTFSFLELEKDSDAHELFDYIVEFLLTQTTILEDITDREILNLYLQITDCELKSESFDLLVVALHKEARLRYNANRVDDIGYELLKCFENYDVIMHRIDALKFTVLKAYLLDRAKLLDVIAKGLDQSKNDLINLNFTKDDTLLSIYQLLKERRKDDKSSIKKLDKSGATSEDFISSPVLLRIVQSKYKSIIKWIHDLLSPGELSKQSLSFIEETLATKLVDNLYMPNKANALEKTRKIIQYKKSAKQKLISLNLSEIFDLRFDNQLCSFDMPIRVNTLDDGKIVNLFIHELLTNIVQSISSDQLKFLYFKISNKKAKYHVIEKDLISIIDLYIQKNTSLLKRIFAFFWIGRDEYRDLIEIKNILAEKPSK